MTRVAAKTNESEFFNYCLIMACNGSSSLRTVSRWIALRPGRYINIPFRNGEFEQGIIKIDSPLLSEKISMSKGTVKWFNAAKGYGFITPEDGGKDLFVHHSEIKSGDDYATLNDGQTVEFEVGQGQKGPCANNVVPV